MCPVPWETTMGQAPWVPEATVMDPGSIPWLSKHQPLPGFGDVPELLGLPVGSASPSAVGWGHSGPGKGLVPPEVPRGEEAVEPRRDLCCPPLTGLLVQELKWKVSGDGHGPDPLQHLPKTVPRGPSPPLGQAPSETSSHGGFNCPEVSKMPLPCAAGGKLRHGLAKMMLSPGLSTHGSLCSLISHPKGCISLGGISGNLAHVCASPGSGHWGLAV